MPEPRCGGCPGGCLRHQSTQPPHAPLPTPSQGTNHPRRPPVGDPVADTNWYQDPSLSRRIRPCRGIRSRFVYRIGALALSTVGYSARSRPFQRVIRGYPAPPFGGVGHQDGRFRARHGAGPARKELLRAHSNQPVLYDAMLAHNSLRDMGTTIAGVLVHTDTMVR